MSGLPSWAQVRPKRRAHIERVAALLAQWADAMNVPAAERDRWARAAYLHDALKDAPEDLLAQYAPPGWTAPELFHGPAAAARAASEGERDQGVLDAATYHSVGYAGWDSAGRMLYLADYLEPGRPEARERRAVLAARVPANPDEVLLEVAKERLGQPGWSAGEHLPESVDFWNALTRRA